MANSEMLSQRKQRCHTGHISINRIILMFIQMIAIFHMVSPMMNILQKSSMNSVPNLTVTCSCSKLWFSQMSKLKNMVIFSLRQRISISMNIPKKNIRRIARIEISLLAQTQSLIMVALLPTSQQRIVMSLYSLAYHTQRAGQHM